MYYFVEVLQAELDRRKNVNAKYSLRSFARFLEIDASSLSAILKCERAYPRRKASEAADKLKLSDEEKKKFIDSLVAYKTDKKILNSKKKSISTADSFIDLDSPSSYTVTFNGNSKNIIKAKKLLKKFNDRLEELFDEENTEESHQIKIELKAP